MNIFVLFDNFLIVYTEYIFERMIIMTYKTSGVCSKEITFEVEDGIVKSVNFIGGCAGNTSGISNLVSGMPVEEVIKRLEGIKCGFRPTSCPDQLAKALKQYIGD